MPPSDSGDPTPADRTDATPRRLFAAAADEPRSRQGTDVLLVVASLIGIASLGFVSSPPSGVERASVRFVAGLPSLFGDLGGLVVTALGAWALLVVVAVVARRRWALLRDVTAAAVAAVLLAAAVGRIGSGTWPSWSGAWELSARDGWTPPLRLAVLAVVVITASPHLTRPARRLGQWLIGLSTVGVVLMGAAMPTAAVAGLCVAAASAGAAHLVFGSCRGWPTLDAVGDALAGLGVDARLLGAADLQRAGVFVVDAVDDDGTRLVVEVHGRDAHDTQLLATFWRSVWYRQPAASVALGRMRQVEHEALMTLLAGQAGVEVPSVVAVGSTDRDDAVLVLARTGEPLAAHPEGCTETVALGLWEVLDRLHRRSMSHGQIDEGTALLAGPPDRGVVGLADWSGAQVASRDHRFRLDEAQVLVTTALGLGVDASAAVAAVVLGPDRTAALLPFVQPAALTVRQRGQLRTSGLDLDELRDTLAERVGVPPPELERMRRVTVRSAVQVALAVVAFTALMSAVGNLDLDALRDALESATWSLVAAGFVVAQLPRLAQAISTMGASPFELPLRPVYALQLALSYIGLAVPTSAARIAVNVRFFQRQGLTAGSALAVGALDGVFGFLVQAVLLGGILLTANTLDLGIDLSGGVPDGLTRVLTVVVGLGIVAGLVVMALPRRRAVLVGWVREAASEALATARGLGSVRRITELVGGNLASDLLFASALGVFVAALGHSVGLTELLVINIGVSLLAGVLPIPGGVGVVEGGLTFGLVQAGVPEETAFAAVLLYRLSTFYLPPIWGFFALRWLERNRHL